MAKQTMGFSSQAIQQRADQKLYHLQVCLMFVSFASKASAFYFPLCKLLNASVVLGDIALIGLERCENLISCGCLISCFFFLIYIYFFFHLLTSTGAVVGLDSAN